MPGRRRLRVPGLKTVQRTGRWLSSRLGPRAVALGYHRIDAPGDDPFGLCTTPERFDEHLAVIRREATPIGIDELIDGLDRGHLPDRAVVVTLDDGYADALHFATPALEARDVPATVFVTSGLLGRVPWWEDLAAAFPIGAPPPARLSLEVCGRSIGWEPVPLSLEADPRGGRIRQLERLLLDWPEEPRARAIEAIARELGGAPEAANRPRGLTREELVRLRVGGRIEIGAHGVHHRPLANLGEEDQRFEIEQSKRTIEQAIGAPVRAFSYPNGSSSDGTRLLVRESGFACAFASHSGVATPRGDRFRLPRFWPSGADTETLARLLRYWG